jgi:hypothetical protein
MGKLLFPSAEARRVLEAAGRGPARLLIDSNVETRMEDRDIIKKKQRNTRVHCKISVPAEARPVPEATGRGHRPAAD